MSHYELTYIVPMSYTVDELPKIVKQVSTILADHGAEHLKETSMGKLKLAYQIGKFSHGYYQVVEFDCETPAIKEINATLKLTNEVLRYMLLTKRIKTEAELMAEQRLREKIYKQNLDRKSIFDEETDEDEKPKRPMHKPVKKIEEKEKVNMEDLDKKLDSILGGEDMLQ